MGSNGGYTIKDSEGYIKPESIPKLATKYPITGSTRKEVADEIPSISNYYDGDQKLNVMRVNCKIYRDPQDCMHNSSCGWCGENNSCVLGNNLGPLESCNRSTYIFSNPYQTVEPRTRVVNQEVGGMVVRTLSRP